MKVLHKFIIKSYIGPMVLTFFLVLFVMLMQTLWLYISDLVGKGLTFGIIVELMGWMALTFIPMALPLSTLFASLMTMGNLGENNELLAMKAAGISLQRILRPLFFLIVFISISAFFASNNLIPYATLKWRSLMYDLRKKKPELTIPEGIFYNDMEGYSIRINKKDPETSLLTGVMIYDHQANRGNLALTIADSGYIKQTPDQQYLLLILYNGQSYQEEMDEHTGDFKPQRGFTRRWFDEQTVIISLDGADLKRTDEALFKSNATMQNVRELNYTYDSLTNIQRNRVQNYSNMISHTTVFFNSPTELDTLAAERERFHIVVNTDSVFESLPTSRKIDAIGRMQARVENAKSQMDTYAVEYEMQRVQIDKAQIEWHRKFTLSVACLVFFFIGAPLGAIIRKGGLGMPMVISVLFFVFYWVIDMTSIKMGQNGVLNPIIATWFSSAVLIPIGIFLTYKATTDSALFSSDRYAAFFNKIFGRMKKLIKRVSLDDVVPVKERLSVIELEKNILELNSLSRQYESDYKLYKNFLWSVRKFTMENGYNKLHNISNKYNVLLSNLVTIDDNERLRELMRQYPALNVKDFKLREGSFNLQAWLPLVYLVSILLLPVAFVFYILILNRRKKLRYILNEIVEINNTVSVTLQKTTHG